MSHRFLHIHVLASLHSLGGDDSMGVVRRCDYNCIRILEHLIEHYTVIVVPLGIRITLEYRFGIVPVHIAESDDIL